MAELRRFIRGHRDIGWVEDRNLIKRCEEGRGGIPHVITDTTRTNAETIGGAGDVADQPMLVTALNGYAGGELREIGGTHGDQVSSRRWPPS